MQVRELFILSVIFGILIIQSLSSRRNWNDDDDEYRQLKRFLFSKDTTSTRSPSVIDQLFFHRTSTSSPYERPVTWRQSTRQPWYTAGPPSSGTCQPNPCEHGGICTARGQLTYDCRCVGAWRGIYCGIADACYNSPCRNGGTCLNIHDDYWCKCPSEYYGNNCQSKYYNPGDSSLQLSNKNCRPNICNTGQCVSLSTTYYCRCPDDRYGEHCEKRFLKRKVSTRQLYRGLLEQIKRDTVERNERANSGESNEQDGTFYDPKNGVFF